MIGSLGVPELLFILVLALLVFGPRKLPEIGRTLGRAMGEFRRATSDLKRTLDVELSSEELSKPPSPTVAPVPQPTATVTSVPSPASEEPTPAEEPHEPPGAEADETRESSE